MKIYLVGGAVRDKLLNLAVTDRDWVVVGASVDEMIKLGYQQVGKDFPVFIHPQTKEEYALARTERKTGKGYHGFAFNADANITLEQDLERRDLTINAMAETEHGQIIDPFNGQADLANGILRHVSPAFIEDPVRILRVARFAARYHRWGFRVAHETNRLMREMVNQGEIDHLVAERVWAELKKALAEPDPQRFFQVLAACGALAIIFPELDLLMSETKTAKHTQQVQMIQALQLLKQSTLMTDRPITRLSQLILAMVYQHNLPVAQLENLYTRWKWDNNSKALITSCVRHYNAIHELSAQYNNELLDFFYHSNAFRQSELFTKTVYSCVLYDALNDKASTQMTQFINHKCKRIAQLAQLCATISAADIDDTSIAGPALGQAIRELRLKKLSQALENDANNKNG